MWIIQKFVSCNLKFSTKRLIRNIAIPNAILWKTLWYQLNKQSYYIKTVHQSSIYAAWQAMCSHLLETLENEKLMSMTCSCTFSYDNQCTRAQTKCIYKCIGKYFFCWMYSIRTSGNKLNLETITQNCVQTFDTLYFIHNFLLIFYVEIILFKGV